MIKRIRDFFCKADPVGLAVGIVIGSVLLAEIILSFKIFLIAIVAGCIMMAVMLAVGWVIYKTIVFAQSFCK